MGIAWRRPLDSSVFLAHAEALLGSNLQPLAGRATEKGTGGEIGGCPLFTFSVKLPDVPTENILLLFLVVNIISYRPREKDFPHRNENENHTVTLSPEG